MTDKRTFEDALRGLETAVERLESGELSLEDALSCYENGIKCAALCRNRLKSVETKVQVLLRERGGGLKAKDAEEF